MFAGMFREWRRRCAVARLDIVDTPAEAAFDRFVENAAKAFDAPYALLSVTRGNDLWFKATAGIEMAAIPRRDTFCNVVLDQRDILEVCQATDDTRFCHLPAVTGAPDVRYYIGAALRTENGIGIGALCVLDVKPRPPASEDQRAYLLALARQASQAFELRAAFALERAA